MKFVRIISSSILLPIYPVLLLLYIYRGVFIGIQSIFAHDTIHWYGNFNYFLISLANRNLPLWDPYSYSGAPFYLNHNIVGALDPTVLLSVPFVWFSKVSVLDIYQMHFLIRFLIFYTGCYVLFYYVSKNKWSALLGATVVLFAMFPNSVWQHGSTLIVSYVPLIMLFLLKIISVETSKKNTALLFMAMCYFVGLSFNMYLPSYILVYFSFTLIYLLVSRTLKINRIHRIVSLVGIKNIITGVVVFFIMAGPFFYSAGELLLKKGENFSYRWFIEEPPTSDVLVHTKELSISGSSSSYRLSFHNLISIFLPGPDNGFLLRGSLSRESFLIVGMVPLICSFLFFMRANAKYKGLFLFLLIIVGFYIYAPDIIYYKLLRYFPGIRTIRQLHNFQGFYILSWGAIISICFSAVMDLINRYKKGSGLLLIWLLCLAIIHGFIIYRYFLLLCTDTSEFFLVKQRYITSYLWVIVLSYLIIVLFLLSRSRRVRFCLIMAMAGITLYQFVDFNVKMRRYVIQPGSVVRTGDIHHNRKFIYKPIRVPFVPRHSTFWGFLPALYHIPSAVPTYFNDYMTLNRRTYDYIRFVSAERQKIISGIGTRRYGFFNKYTIAKDSVHALSLIGRMPVDMLHDVLVLEEDPMKVISGASELELVRAESIDTSSTLVRGCDQQMTDFYDRIARVNYKDPNVQKDGDYLRVKLALGHPALDWPWDTEHIGYFQAIIALPEKGSSYKPFAYFPIIGIRTGYKDDSICYIDIPEWIVKHVLPGFYDYIYDEVLYPSDLERIGDELFISPELQGAFVTDDIVGPMRDSEISGFTVVSLAPAKVTPYQSLYGRDEPSEVIGFGPNRISFKVNNSKPGLFYYADSFAKDWKATVDGIPTHIFRADFNYKAVYVPKGEHVITFRFNPWIYRFLMWVFIVFSVPGMALPIVALFCTKAK